MSVSDCVDNWSYNISSVLLCEDSFIYNSLEELAAAEKVKNNKDVLSVFKNLSALHNVRMVNLGKNHDLVLKRRRFFSTEHGLLHDLNGYVFTCCFVDTFFND
eukprot:CAMPEP_0168321408 /NCGR_PEP_ID=MMETSP0213-20121227/2258_1 /TAXON_ID=151035 /ORGANISM="Euplotes harpa, Strain FSP1.4" /LENGTH=102 /DNA_ID=CAMNT_0008323063 /DNA_START=584 /DNA_END=892 /DNA_ORIENTATION=+